MTHYSGYTEGQIKPISELMLDYLHQPVAHEAFFRKYASKKFLKGMSDAPRLPGDVFYKAFGSTDR